MCQLALIIPYRRGRCKRKRTRCRRCGGGKAADGAPGCGGFFSCIGAAAPQLPQGNRSRAGAAALLIGPGLGGLIGGRVYPPAQPGRSRRGRERESRVCAAGPVCYLLRVLLPFVLCCACCVHCGHAAGACGLSACGSSPQPVKVKTGRRSRGRCSCWTRCGADRAGRGLPV